MAELTAVELRQALDYDPLTGVFTWLSGHKRGRVAGGVTQKGYARICIKRKYYNAHRLAWLFMHGEWPKFQIDHIDRVKTNNRINNLRDVSGSINCQNRHDLIRGDSSSGLLGVTWHKRLNKWQAQIGVPNRSVRYLGLFDTAQQAHSAYIKAKREVHPGFVENTL